MKIRAVIYSLILASAALSVCSCSKDVDDGQIKDFIQKKYYSENYSSERIKSVSINDRETDRKEENEEIWCTVISEDAESEFTRFFYLTAEGSNGKDWKLNNISKDNTGSWKSVPINGMSENSIIRSIYGKNVSVGSGNYQWNINRSSLVGFQITKRKSKINSGTDDVYATVSLKTDIMKVSVPVHIRYEYDNGWKIDNFETLKEVEPVYLSGQAPTIRNEKLIEDICSYQLTVGGYYSEQNITMDPEKIKNFEITGSETTLQGYHYNADCSFDYEINSVLIKVLASVSYDYNEAEDLWNCKYVSYSSESVEKADLTGVWNGSYYGIDGKSDFSLNISKQDDSGNLTAVFTYPTVKDEEGNIVSSGSFNMTGKLRKDDLSFSLKGTDWIEYTEGLELFSLTGQYKPENGEIQSTSGYTFSASR